VKRSYFLSAATMLLACSSSESTSPQNDTGTPETTEDVVTDVPASDGDASSGPVVATDRGPVTGTKDGSGGIFLGIPYAAPPTGTKRFAPPEKHDPWTSLETTKLGKACPQGPDTITKIPVSYDEDCLTLNVWTKNLAPAAPAPVMVFIHGGGFVAGSSNLAFYDGERLSREGVVVVTINYRLGPLGFLALPTLGTGNGNFGLLDQQRALEWVRDNAKAFGGDPSNVTIFGESAGGISVCLHLVAPSSKGLFHRAISESGTCSLVNVPTKDPGTPSVEDSAEELGLRFAKSLGCDTGDVVTCLRGKSADDIVAKSSSTLDLTKPGVAFGPSVDLAFLPENPRTRLSKGPANDVPYMVGTNADEGTIFTLALTITTDADYRAAVTTLTPTFATELLKIYPSTDFPTPKAAYNHLLRDVLFTCPARSTVRAVAPRVKQTHLYYFSHVPAIGKTTGLGSFHSAELPFVFGNFRDAFASPTADETALSNATIGYFTRFAKTGDPGGTPAWPQYTTTSDPHLVLDTPITASTALDQKHCDALAALAP